MAERDTAGQRKVRLMTAWVSAGIVILVAGLFTSPWIILLGACIIGSTPVWFTLRMALAPPRTPKAPADPLGDALRRTPARAPTARRPTRPRRRGH